MLEGRSTASAERRAEGLTEWGFPRDEASIASANIMERRVFNWRRFAAPFFTLATFRYSSGLKTVLWLKRCGFMKICSGSE